MEQLQLSGGGSTPKTILRLKYLVANNRLLKGFMEQLQLGFSDSAECSAEKKIVKKLRFVHYK